MNGVAVTLAQHTRAVHMQDVGDRLARSGRLAEEAMLSEMVPMPPCM